MNIYTSDNIFPLQGRPDIRMVERLLLQTRFDETTGCLIPTKAPYNSTGACQIRINGKLYSMRRIAFTLSGRRLKPGQVVGRTCDNPACIAPQHLRAMTRSEATVLALARGTRKVVTRRIPPNRKAQIIAFAQTGASIQETADRFDITRSSARGVLKRARIDRRPCPAGRHKKATPAEI